MIYVEKNIVADSICEGEVYDWNSELDLDEDMTPTYKYRQKVVKESESDTVNKG